MHLTKSSLGQLSFIVLFLFASANIFGQNQLKKTIPNRTATWNECISFYRNLSQKYPSKIKLIADKNPDENDTFYHVYVGSGLALHKPVIMINNAIHPGEPEGVDATMMLADELMANKKYEKVLKEYDIIIIPGYNQSGMRRRSCCSRVNQDGPSEYGFRGNSQNLDLNRDFIKCDSREAMHFTKVFHTYNPIAFIDNHTSDGADYQYTLTCLSNAPRLPKAMSEYLHDRILVSINKQTTTDGFEMSPYVEPMKQVPDSGIAEDVYSPRFGLEYATLFNAYSFTVETHMLKPFPKRVAATYSFMNALLFEFTEHKKEILDARKTGMKQLDDSKEMILTWKLDTAHYDLLPFKGYAAKYKASKISGEQRLYYDEKEPYTKNIKYFRYNVPGIMVQKPSAYLLPSTWIAVRERLEWNGIKMQKLTVDTTLDAEVYYITNFANRNPKMPYEGHYLHTNVEVQKKKEKITGHKGDYIIPIRQESPEGITMNQYIPETLEPQATDAFFAWNFFDGILQQKEYYSDYVFEDIADSILKNDPKLKEELVNKKNSDEAFAKNPRAQLDFIYMHSKYFEGTVNRYPVVRIF